MDKGYSIYKIDKEILIDSVSKSTLYYQKINIKKTVVSKEDLDQEEKNKFEESIRQKLLT